MVAAVLSALDTVGCQGTDLFKTPLLLSCEHDEDLVAFGATLDASARTPHAKEPPAALAHALRGLPKNCASMDEDLFEWAVVNMHWDPNEFWDGFKVWQYDCGPSKGEDECEGFTGRTHCLYGWLASAVCITVMYAWHSQALANYTWKVLEAVDSLQALLQSGERQLEFLDSSGWSFIVEDIAAIVTAYTPALALSLARTEADEADERARSAASSASIVSAALREGRGERPWTRGAEPYDSMERMAGESLAMVARWTWPPRAPTATYMAREPFPAGARLVQMYSVGTHCSVMAEPISAMSILLADEFELRVAWRGARDYCGYLSGSWPVPVIDEGSSVKAVMDAYADKAEPGPRRDHRDSIRDPIEYVAAMERAMADDVDFVAADFGFCSEPALACLAMRRSDPRKALLGYFGVNVGFLVRGEAEQLGFYKEFRDKLTMDPRSTYATVAPYISLQLLYHMPAEVPAVRPLSLYTLPATYTATREKDVFVGKRPIAFFDISRVLGAFSLANERQLNFVDAAEMFKLGTVAFQDIASFRAGVYFPYDWLQTMAFYDWINMCLPTFIPDIPIYAFARGTNAPDEWLTTSWHAPSSVYPFHYGDWDSFAGRVYWWLLNDFHALPGVRTFRSIAELFDLLSSRDKLWEQSGQLRQSHIVRTSSASRFWRDALLRGLAKDQAPRSSW